MSEKIIMIVVSLVCGQLVICGGFFPSFIYIFIYIYIYIRNIYIYLYINIYIDTHIFGQKHIFPTSVPWHKLSYMVGCAN